MMNKTVRTSRSLVTSVAAILVSLVLVLGLLPLSFVPAAEAAEQEGNLAVGSDSTRTYAPDASSVKTQNPAKTPPPRSIF